MAGPPTMAPAAAAVTALKEKIAEIAKEAPAADSKEKAVLLGGEIAAAIKEADLKTDPVAVTQAIISKVTDVVKEGADKAADKAAEFIDSAIKANAVVKEAVKEAAGGVKEAAGAAAQMGMEQEREDAIIETAKEIIEIRHSHESSWLGEVFGTIYTTIWALAWYPQIRANYKEKSAIGYCYDLVIYNTYGFILYSIYTVSQYRYQVNNDLEFAVEWQDLFFAFHSLAVNLFYMCQAWYYDGRPFFVGVGWFCRLYILLSIGGLGLQLLAYYGGMIPWCSAPGAMNHGKAEADWSVVEYLGIVKAIITIIKYPSQVVFNMDRRSCLGMSVFGFTMDLGGGAAALAQNVSDSVIMNDITFMTANIPKIIVAGSSVFWDMVIVYQGLWLYRNAAPLPVEERVSSRKPDSYTAQFLTIFAPAPWPPIDEEEAQSPNSGMELGNYNDGAQVIGNHGKASTMVGDIKVDIELEEDPSVTEMSTPPRNFIVT